MWVLTQYLLSKWVHYFEINDLLLLLFQGIFFIYVAGISVSAIIFILELVAKRKKHSVIMINKLVPQKKENTGREKNKLKTTYNVELF